LPGSHHVYTVQYGYLWFSVAADGTFDYDTALDGMLSGRGTRTLTFLPTT
jgi:hypothetical protein